MLFGVVLADDCFGQEGAKFACLSFIFIMRHAKSKDAASVSVCRVHVLVN